MMSAMLVKGFQWTYISFSPVYTMVPNVYKERISSVMINFDGLYETGLQEAIQKLGFPHL
jgi:hypothetical protein